MATKKLKPARTRPPRIAKKKKKAPKRPEVDLESVRERLFGEDVYEELGSIGLSTPDSRSFKYGLEWTDCNRMTGFFWFDSAAVRDIAADALRKEEGDENVHWTGTFQELRAGESQSAQDLRERFWEGRDQSSSRPIPSALVAAFAEHISQIGV